MCTGDICADVFHMIESFCFMIARFYFFAQRGASLSHLTALCKLGATACDGRHGINIDL
jgi:hypothetical protein